MTWTFKLARRIAGRSALLATTVSVLALTACGGSVTGPETGEEESPTPVVPTPTAVPGVLLLQLDTPSGDDGAVQFMVNGPAIDSIRASGYQGYGSSAGTTGQLIVTGSVHDGLVAKVFVHDISRASEYHVAIIAAAARNTYALQDLQGYGAALTR